MTKRFHKLNSRWADIEEPVIYDNLEQKALNIEQSVELLNNLIEERDYWKKNAMTLLMQVRSLTPRMTDEEVRRYNQELEGIG